MTEWDAATYDQVAAPMTGRGTELVDTLDLDGSETVLDAGCGTGQVTARVRERAAHVIALDASQAMLDRCRERLGDSGITYVRADLREPLPVEPVDAIVSTSTLHWVVDHAALFRHLLAALKPGGTLTAEYGGRGNLENVYRHVRALGLEETGKRYAGVEETLGWLADAGFVDTRAKLIARPDRVDDLPAFLATATLKEYPADVRDEVASRMGSGELDYVRMMITARRSG